jgi:hypothetical protein
MVYHQWKKNGLDIKYKSPANRVIYWHKKKKMKLIWNHLVDWNETLQKWFMNVLQ